MSVPSKILVLSVSAGAGHTRAAQAICVAAEMKGIKATHVDVMQHVPSTFRKIYTDSYLKLVEKLPQVWAYLYESSDHRQPSSTINRIRRMLERLNTRKLAQLIEDERPDAIVCTHFLPAEILSYRLARHKILPPVYVQVTDFDLHALWVQPRLQGYFAGNDEVAFRMSNRGLPADKVHVTGIPIMPQFSEIPERRICAETFGLNPELPTAMMMAGGLGIGGLDELVKRVLSNPQPFQLIVLAGKNQKLLERLQVLAQQDQRLVPMGFTSQVHLIMGACDIAITKPGGLTTAECLAAQLPMVVISPIPGQEERNCDYLLEQGVAVKACDPAMLEYKLLAFLQNPERLQLMREKMKLLGRANAAVRVVDIIEHDLKHST